MIILNADDCRRSAERCSRRALTVADSNEWVRFFQAWETIAATFKRLKAAKVDGVERDRGAGVRASTA